MDIESGSFDKAMAIRRLAREHRLLAGRVAELESGAPSANMDASSWGMTLYLGDGFNEKAHLALAKAGYLTKDSLRAASDQDLLAVDGVGKATLTRIRDVLK